MPNKIIGSPMIAKLFCIPTSVLMLLKINVIGIKSPRIKFGTVVVTTALMFVPNCSAAFDIITAQ